MDSLKIAADSVADTLARVAQVMPDSVDWVQECAYRQAMLIERIDLWMDVFVGMFWPGLIVFFIYATYRSIKDFSKSRKNRKSDV